jgi:hypothetical protein
MRKIFLATALFTGVSTIALNAKTTGTQTPASATQQNETPVKADDLPAPVKATLATEAYAKMNVSAASLVKDGETEYYKIELSNGDSKQVVKLDKNGQMVK